MTDRRQRLHASTVAIDGSAVLIRGASGAGKSSLALRLIDGGAMLVADDQTIVESERGGLVASAPDRLRGQIEVRGLGIVVMPVLARAPVALVVDLLRVGEIERLPAPDHLACELLGHRLARVEIDANDAAAAARVRVALRHLAGGGEPHPVTLVTPGEQC